MNEETMIQTELVPTTPTATGEQTDAAVKAEGSELAQGTETGETGEAATAETAVQTGGTEDASVAAAAEDLPSEDAILAALRETHPGLAERLEKAVAPTPAPTEAKQEIPVTAEERHEQTFAIVRERQQIAKNLANAANQHNALLDRIEEKTALLEEAEEGSKIRAALQREVQDLESKRLQWANYHAQLNGARDSLAEVAEFVRDIPALAPYPHDYYVLARDGKITADMKLQQILNLIHAHRAATGRAAKPVLRETGQPATRADNRAVIAKVLAKVGGDKPSGKGGAATTTTEKTSTLSPAALAALEYAKKR